VEAAQEIASSNFEVGVRINFENNVVAKKSRFVIPSRPSPVYSKNIDGDGESKWKEN
jgi:hypothetical protein